MDVNGLSGEPSGRLNFSHVDWCPMWVSLITNLLLNAEHLPYALLNVVEIGASGDMKQALLISLFIIPTTPNLLHHRGVQFAHLARKRNHVLREDGRLLFVAHGNDYSLILRNEKMVEMLLLQGAPPETPKN